MHFLIYFALFYIVNGLVFFKVFQKAGKKGWEAFIPVYNEYVILRIINRPVWWLIFIFLPGLDLLFAFVVLVELAKCFGKFKLWEQAAAVLAGFIYFPYLGFSKDEKFYGADATSGYQRSVAREWVDAIIFALVAATVIRSFYIEAYTIPTPSLEETLLVDDYLFVSKFNYGARIPMTPLAFPLAHNTMPLIGGKSYFDWPHIPYYRLPGFQKIKNYDIVVFNYPAEDTALGRPVDKKDNYIKRCIGIPGDSLKIADRQIYINGKHLPMPETSQADFEVYISRKNADGIELINEIDYYMPHDGQTAQGTINPNSKLYAWKKMGIDPNISVSDIHRIVQDSPAFKSYRIFMTRKTAAALNSFPGVIKTEIISDKKGVYDPETGPVFPNFAPLHWNKDFYGPLYIPKKGDHIKMNLKNYVIYQKAIREYEDNPSFKISPDSTQFYLEGKPVTEYVMKMDYYFMMGDNRDNSADSRFWGFVPEDHIVGKPMIVWLSIDHDVPWYKKIRWNRMFRTI
jgi:signal peptidase I